MKRKILSIAAAISIISICLVYNQCAPVNGTYSATGSASTASPLALWPTSESVSPSSNTSFQGLGGTPPYSFRVAQGSGQINSSTGAYVAPSSAGTDIILITDTAGGYAYATVTITSSGGTTTGPGGGNAPVINQSSITLPAGAQFTFTANFGTPPYIWQAYASGPALLGTLNAQTGAYQAPVSAGTDEIQVRDNNGVLSQPAIITISASSVTLTATPPSATVASGGTQQFTVSGGTGPYYYKVVQGSSGVSVSATGLFQAPNVSVNEEDEIEIWDSAGHAIYPVINVTTGTAVASGVPVEIYRYVNSTLQDHLYSIITNEVTGSGWILETPSSQPQYYSTANGGFFQVYSNSSVAGTVPLYRCRTNTATQRHFLSPTSNCEGQLIDGSLGYMYPASNATIAGTYALYRFLSPNGDDHFETIIYAEGANAGYHPDPSYAPYGTIGYVFSP